MSISSYVIKHKTKIVKEQAKGEKIWKMKNSYAKKNAHILT